jgi:hypothetical protein
MSVVATPDQIAERHRLGLTAKLVMDTGGLVLEFGVTRVLGHEHKGQPARALEVA